MFVIDVTDAPSPIMTRLVYVCRLLTNCAYSARMLGASYLPATARAKYAVAIIK